MKQQWTAEECSRVVRDMLASELQVESSTLTDDFRLLSHTGVIQTECFLEELNDVFILIPVGLSLGSGEQLFRRGVDDGLLERIATVGGLVAYVVLHAVTGQPNRAG